MCPEENAAGLSNYQSSGRNGHNAISSLFYYTMDQSISIERFDYQKLVLPVGLNAFYTFHPVHSLAEPRAAASIAFFGAFVVTAVFAARRRSPAFVCLALIVAPLLPALYISKLGENVFTERYLYLPSSGFAVLAGMAFSRLHGKSALRLPAIAALVLVLAAF